MGASLLSCKKKFKKRSFFFKKTLIIGSICLIILSMSGFSPHWGFWAHKRINRLAVFRLPPQMLYFYKKNIDYLTENAVNPDQRRYAVLGEAERHFIDLDVYGDSASSKLPKFWSDAVKKIGEDSLRKHGIVPWYVQSAAFQLTEAFRQKSPARILRISADLGHYIADANVPLHTTKNYNGQFTGQEGIHGFWESRLPELHATRYNLWLGQAEYVAHISNEIWNAVDRAHLASDSVFLFEKRLTMSFEPEKKFSYESRNNILVHTYSEEFSGKYHDMLNGQVERQMKNSVKMVADIWYTCWINAGQPDLQSISEISIDENQKKEEATERQSWLRRLFHIRTDIDN